MRFCARKGLLRTGNRELRTGEPASPTAILRRMRLHRWTAGLLLFVMLVPGFGPLAMASAAPMDAMHCMRQPMQASRSAQAGTQSSSQSSPSTMQAGMPCHHAMAMAASKETSPSDSSSGDFSSDKTSFRAADNCCQDHNCCCCSTTSEWARPATNLLSFFDLLIESARHVQPATLRSSDVSGQDSARAPPLS